MQQITPKLYIGDMQDALMSADSTNIDVIIYLGQEIPLKLCFGCSPACLHMPLNDGENGLTKLRKVIFISYIVALDDSRVLVACRAGISRSVVVATAMYALIQNISFDEAYKYIKEKRLQVQPELNLLREVKQITEELKYCL